MATKDAYDNFKTRVRTVGLPTGSRYRVNVMGMNVPDIFMFANSVSIPGVSIDTADTKIWGENLTMPYGISYEPVTLTFILDNEMSAKVFFDSWMNKVYDRKTRFVGYAKEYKRNVNIVLQDKNNKDILNVTLIDAYPKQIQDVALSYDSKDVIALTVQLQYKNWIKDYDTGSVYAADANSANTRGVNTPIGTTSPSGGGTVPLSLPTDTGRLPFNFEARDIENSLANYGSQAGAEMGTQSGSIAGLFGTSPISGASSLLSSFSDLSNNFVSFGSGITNLGRSLTAITAPAGQIAGAVNSISGTLGGIDTVLSSVGLGKPFAKVRTDLNGTASKIGAVAGLKGMPGNIASLGVNFSSMGNQFNQVSRSLDTVPGATAKLKNSIASLGNMITGNGSDLNNASAALQQHVDEEEST